MKRVNVVICASLAETLGSESNFEEIFSDDETRGGWTVADLLTRLAAKYYRLSRLVFDPRTRRLTGETLVFLNGRAVGSESDLKIALHDHDAITLIPFMEGG